MPAEEVSLAAAIYASVLFCAGLGCLLHFLFLNKTAKRIDALETTVGRWPLSPADFFTGACGIIFVSLFAVYGISQISGGLDEEMRNILAATFSQLAALAALMAFMRFAPEKFTPPMNGRNLSWASAAKLALYTFLIVVPIIWPITAVWSFLLETLGHPAPKQEPVRWFEEADNLALLIMMVVTTVLVAPLTEELLFRGCFYRFLKAKIPLVFALGVSGLIFSLLHYNVLGVVPLFVLGVVLAYSYEKTGNLKVPILLHAFWNANTVIIILLTAHLT